MRWRSATTCPVTLSASGWRSTRLALRGQRPRSRPLARNTKASFGGVSLSAQTKKNQDRLIDPFHILGVETPDAVSQFIFRHCRDLVDHKSRKSIEAVAFVGRNQNAKQRCFSWIGGNRANRNGFGCIETVILQNDRRSRLARVILAAGDRPYFSTPQSLTRLD
jgi:hypothetical protein